MFWLNAAETWVDIEKQSEGAGDSNFVKNIVNLVAGSNSRNDKPAVNAYFMSETGIVDVFFMLGPNPYDVTRQYSRLTGTAPLPPVRVLSTIDFPIKHRYFIFIHFYSVLRYGLPSKSVELQ